MGRVHGEIQSIPRPKDFVLVVVASSRLVFPPARLDFLLFVFCIISTLSQWLLHFLLPRPARPSSMLWFRLLRPTSLRSSPVSHSTADSPLLVLSAAPLLTVASLPSMSSRRESSSTPSHTTLA